MSNFVIPWTVAGLAPLSMGFSRQEYWNGLSCPPPRDLSYPGAEPTSFKSPALASGFFTNSATWEILIKNKSTQKFDQRTSRVKWIL